jgi:ABC-type siderophore export system fused ATPase/permease subunit
MMLLVMVVIISIQLSSSLLMCRVYSQTANYRNSTTQMTSHNEQDTKETDTTKTNT